MSAGTRRTRGARTGLPAARSRLLVLFVHAVLVPGCGTDVDLGGTSGVADAGPPQPNCSPCSTGAGCASGTCAQFAGDLFCGAVCAGGTGCAATETCSSVTATTATSVNVCVPTSGVCAPATAPPARDGGALDHCGALNGPQVASSCEACGKYSNDCQPNGCYGGYWCNEPERDCTPPPSNCP